MAPVAEDEENSLAARIEQEDDFEDFCSYSDGTNLTSWVSILYWIHFEESEQNTQEGNVAVQCWKKRI